jgi:hypothetical protein
MHQIKLIHVLPYATAKSEKKQSELVNQHP